MHITDIKGKNFISQLHMGSARVWTMENEFFSLGHIYNHFVSCSQPSYEPMVSRSGTETACSAGVTHCLLSAVTRNREILTSDADEPEDGV